MNTGNNEDDQTLLGDSADFAEGPTGGKLKKWLAGFIAAAVPVVLGIRCWLAGHVTIYGRGSSIEITDQPAKALSLFFIALGSFLHFHYLTHHWSWLSTFYVGVVIAYLAIIVVFIRLIFGREPMESLKPANSVAVESAPYTTP